MRKAIVDIVAGVDRHSVVALAAGALVGVIAGVLALDPGFIAGTGQKWITPENDYVAYLVAWRYYVMDAWRLPLFAVPAMGYPEGGSVLFNDALPIAAFITKVLYGLSGVLVNPFGWWVFLTYVLQGAAAARMMRAVGVVSLWACVSGAALAVVSTAFVPRMGHTALSTHAVLLWAIGLHFSTLRSDRARTVEWTSLLAVTLLINAYLFVMVFALAVATFAAVFARGRTSARDLRSAAIAVCFLVALGLFAGYGPLLTNPSAMQTEGFGKYSWNLTGLLVPPRELFGALVPRDATHGQYEGEAYVGMGALLLLGLALVSSPRRVLGLVRRYWVFCGALAVMAVFAASNRVYAGETLLFSYDLPRLVFDVSSSFRASGRFIWPLAYSLTLLPLACLFRWWHPLPAVLVACVAVLLQVSEAAPGFEYRRRLTTESYRDLIDEPRVTAWLTAHRRVWQFPSWDCGGLSGSERRWPSDNSNRELQLQLAAARAGVPINSVYSSRARKDCVAEARWAEAPRFDDGVLYVLAPAAVRDVPALAALAGTPACVPTSWAAICSTAWVHR